MSGAFRVGCSLSPIISHLTLLRTLQPTPKPFRLYHRLLARFPHIAIPQLINSPPAPPFARTPSPLAYHFDMSSMSHPESERKRRRGSLSGSVAALSIDAACMASKSFSSGAAAPPSNSEQLASNTSSSHHTLGTCTTVSRLRLLELPVEILLQISTQLCGTKAILNMAVANKQLHSLTSEAMAKHLVIPPNRIKQAIEILTRRPELISKVNSIDLGAYMAAHTRGCVCVSKIAFNRKARRMFRTLLPTSTKELVTWDQLQQVKRKLVRLWSPNHQFLMAILLALCPNVKEVRMQMPKVVGFDRMPLGLSFPTVTTPTPTPNHVVLPVTLFQGPVLAVMQRKLQSLTIPPNDKWIGPVKQEVLMIENDMQWRRHGKNIVTFKGFHKLKHLDLPMDLLGLPASVVFQSAGDAEVSTTPVKVVTEMRDGELKERTMMLPAKVLPLSLTSLRLRSCTKHTFALLQRINEVPIDKFNIKHVEVFFDGCARTSIVLCYKEDRGGLDYLKVLSALAAKGIEVLFFTGPNAQPTDFIREIQPLRLISPCEAGLIALPQKQFSNLNIVALQHRLSVSPSSRKIFARHALSHFDLLNRATFEANKWEQVAFFHGTANTKYDPRLQESGGKAVHVNVRVGGMDDHVFEWSMGVGMPREGSAPRAVVYGGKVFSIRSGGEDEGAMSDEPVHKSDKAMEKAKTMTKLQPEGILSTVRKPSRNVEQKSYPSLRFKCDEDLWRVEMGKVWDGDVWQGVRWKSYVQPYVEKMRV